MRDEVCGVQFWLLFGVLLLSGGLVIGQNECEESELGYSCKKQMTDYFALHWSLGPTTAGAEAAEGEIAMAMVGETEGWVGFAFAEVPGAMAPADFIIGWVDPDDGPVVTAYRSEIRFISNTDEHESLDLRDTQGSEENGMTTIRFVRSLSDGFTEVVVDDEIPVNVAVGEMDALEIHSLREASTVMLMLASESSTSERESPTTEAPAIAPSTEVQASEPPLTEAQISSPTSEDQLDCASSDLGYSCSLVLSDRVTMHWTLGPAEATDSIPELGNEDLAVAVVGQTTGWVGIVFPEQQGVMVPAEGVIGWVTDSGQANVGVYELTSRAVEGVVRSENQDAIRGTTCSEEDGVTTVTFVYDLSTLPGDFDPAAAHVNWAVRNDDDFMIHTEREGTTVNLLGALSLDADETPSPISETADAPETEEARQMTPLLTDGCASVLGYSCSAQYGSVTFHWTVGPADANEEAPEVNEGEVAIALVAETTGWIGIGIADVPGQMAPADVVLGWVSNGTATISGYRISGRTISEDEETEDIGIRATQGSEVNGRTTIQFVLTGELTNEVDFGNDLNLNFAVGDSDSLVYHSDRNGQTVNLLSDASPDDDDVSQDTAEARETTPAPGEGCATSNLGYSCSAQYGPVTFHWTVGPGEENEEAPAVNGGELAVALVAETDGWIGIGVADSAGMMAPADVVLGWVNGGAASITGYRISGRSISEDEETEDIGIRASQGTEVGGITTLQFILTGQLTNDVNFEEDVNLNFALGGSDSLVIHSYRSGQTVNLLSGSSTEELRDLKYHRVHGAMMIIAWIGLAPFGVLVARNKYAFSGISEGAWFQIHRAVQISALVFMFIGMVIALEEFDDPETTEGKRHRKVGIAILVIGFFQGAVPFLRPGHHSPYRFFFNFFHGNLGRGSVGLGIATVFLGIQAYDQINRAHVDRYWITCVAILGVYFALAVIGEVIVAYRRQAEHSPPHQGSQQQQPQVEMT